MADLCRSTNIYEIVKIKDFDDCRIDPLETRATPAQLRFSFSSNGEPAPQVENKQTLKFINGNWTFAICAQFKRSAAYKYVACGGSAERATIVDIDGSALVTSPGPLGMTSRQTVRVALKSRGQIHQLLPNVTRPKVHDTLVYSPPDASSRFVCSTR